MPPRADISVAAVGALPRSVGHPLVPDDRGHVKLPLEGGPWVRWCARKRDSLYVDLGRLLLLLDGGVLEGPGEAGDGGHHLLLHRHPVDPQHDQQEGCRQEDEHAEEAEMKTRVRWQKLLCKGISLS